MREVVYDLSIAPATAKRTEKDHMSKLLCYVIGLCVLVPGTAAAASTLRPPREVSAFQQVTFSVLRQPATRSVPRRIVRFAAGPGRMFGLNPALTRQVVAPDSDAKHPWYVIPGYRSLCLESSAGGTCQSDQRAAAGKLWVQLIPLSTSNLNDPIGTGPITSRIVGVIPTGVTSVTASTKSGTDVSGVVRGGMLAVSGTDLTALQLQRPTLIAPVFSH